MQALAKPAYEVEKGALADFKEKEKGVADLVSVKCGQLLWKNSKIRDDLAQ